MPVDPSEILSRYIFTEKYLRRDNSVKWQAFKPRNNETSVYRTSDLPESDIWDIGTGIQSSSGRNLKGRADIRTLSVLNVSLDVVESITPARHANIAGWPDNYAEMMHLAQKLSEVSQGYRFNTFSNSNL